MANTGPWWESSQLCDTLKLHCTLVKDDAPLARLFHLQNLERPYRCIFEGRQRSLSDSIASPSKAL